MENNRLIEQPLVSIVIPCYNREKYISDAIDSALAQTYSNIEVIVVDDGSIDGSVDVVRQYGDRVKLVLQDNGGVNVARNRCFRESRGDFLVFLDSDDWLSPDIVECHVKTARQFPEAGIFCAGASFVQKDGTVTDPVPSKYPCEPSQALELALLQPPPFPACEMYRRSVVERAGYFDENMKAYSDSAMRLRAILRGKKIVRTDGGFAVYRPVENSITKNSFRLYRFGVKLIRLLEKEFVTNESELAELLRERLLRLRLRYWNEIMQWHISWHPFEIMKLLVHLLRVTVIDRGYPLFVLFEKPWELSMDKSF